MLRRAQAGARPELATQVPGCLRQPLHYTTRRTRPRASGASQPKNRGKGTRSSSRGPWVDSLHGSCSGATWKTVAHPFQLLQHLCNETPKPRACRGAREPPAPLSLRRPLAELDVRGIHHLLVRWRSATKYAQNDVFDSRIDFSTRRSDHPEK